MTRRRLDLELVRRGLATGRDQAAELIESGRVRVGGRPAFGGTHLVAPEEPIAVERAGEPYASRGGRKLEAALDRLAVNPAGRRALDAGAGTGGFTDVLLARGAAHVVAADVGYGQLAWRLRTDPRVTVLERVNVRALDPASLPYAAELIVADLSFISLASVLPALSRVAAEGADLVLLVKPQFEASPGDVGPGGVVRDPATWRRAIGRVVEASSSAGAGPLAVVPSAVRGPAGNVEFFLHARMGEPPSLARLETVVREVVP